ncbi:MAG TPA: glycosyltransferase [Rubricoccaceae bacterium]
MDVSIVIPAHTKERRLERAVRSAHATRGGSRELVVDGSTNRTYDDVWRVHAETGVAVALYRKVIGDVSSALNEGVRRATGALVGTRASDDSCLPGKTAVQVEALAELGPVDALVHGDALDDVSDGQSVDTSRRQGAVAEGACFEGLLCDDVHVLAPSAYADGGTYGKGRVTEDLARSALPGGVRARLRAARAAVHARPAAP